MTQTQQWQQLKLRRRVVNAEALMVEIDNPVALSKLERQQILENCQSNNLSFYRSRKPISDSRSFRALATQLGLDSLCDNPQADANKISHITTTKNSRYIPYTNRALSWHTDGYYNDDADIIRTFMMHCVQPATEGGVNTYLDHEIIYLLLYQKEPAYVEALKHPQAFTIPANDSERGCRSSPVFRIDPVTNQLLMHYTERARHIQWHPSCIEALNHLRELLRTTEYTISYKLAAGEGVICNNVLHSRSAFRDSDDMPKRLLYRARFRNRIGYNDALKSQNSFLV
ncbi:MAG: TauD/TfdA family dioxygenase [Chromatiales bacterium]|nr:TauD/TfdA family dioxygenase [Chromatiales bacterium]